MDFRDQQARFGEIMVGQPKKKKGGFLRSIASGIAEPFSYLINTTITNPIKQTAAQLSGNKTAMANTKREALTEMGLGEKGTDIVGGLKKWGGNSAQAILAAANPAVSSVKGATAMGGAAGAGSALTQRDSSIEDILTGGLTGAVTGGALQKTGNILSKRMSGKLGTKLENAGNRLMGTQANLTRVETRKLGRGVTPASVLGNINKRTGIANMDSMRNVADNVTGGDGVFSELTRNAIGNSKGVDISGLRKTAEDIITNKAPLLSNAERKNIIQQVSNSAVKGYGGSSGSLSKLADPFESFDVAKSFEAMASDIRRSATVTAKDKQLANVYSDLARNINDNLFSAKGVKEGLDLAKPQAIANLKSLAKTAPKKEAQAYQKLAKELENVKDIKSLRSAQADFVNLNKIDEATANAQAGAGAQFGDQVQGLGRLVQKPTNLLALPLNAATPNVAGAMTRAGKALKGAQLPSLPQGVVPDLLRTQGIRGASAAASNATMQPQDQQVTPEVSGMGSQIDFSQGSQYDQVPMFGRDNMTDAGSILGGSQEPQSMYSRENAAMDIQRDLQATGGKNMDKYLQLFEFMNPEPSKDSQKPLSEAQQNRQDLMTSLGMAENVMAGGSINYGPIGSRIEGIKSIFNAADPETMSYKNVIGQVRGAITKARAGASLTAGELKLLDTYTPKDTDSEQVVRSKLQQLNALYGGTEPVGGVSPQDILSQYGY